MINFPQSVQRLTIPDRAQIDGSSHMIGEKLGRLTVVGAAPSAGSKRRWHCSCDCGGETIAFQWSLRAGRSRSCGCLKAEELNKRQDHELHGMHASPEYRAWKLMKTRCYNPRFPEYPTYGGRGATVCEEWKTSFTAFLRDVGPRPSQQHRLVRIDDQQSFCPGNAHWLKTRSRVPKHRRHEVRRDLSILDEE
jgi:hypothetical protein